MTRLDANGSPRHYIGWTTVGVLVVAAICAAPFVIGRIFT